jgi:hypothetical protein
MVTINQGLDMIQKVKSLEGSNNGGGDGSNSWWAPLLREAVGGIGEIVRVVAPYAVPPLISAFTAKSNPPAAEKPNGVPVTNPSLPASQTVGTSVGQPAAVTLPTGAGQAGGLPPAGAGAIPPASSSAGQPAATQPVETPPAGATLSPQAGANGASIPEPENVP